MTDEIRIGVTGHRPHKLNTARLDTIAGDLARIFTRARDSLVPAALTCVTSLAEGADTMAAEAALSLGLKLVSPLPFPASDYVQDFAPGEARDTFLRLLGRARSAPCTTSRAALEEDAYGYRAASMAMLDQSHALVAVWDGHYTHLLGGAYDTLSEALARGMPVLWVDARGERPPRVLAPADLATLSSGGVATGHGDEGLFIEGLKQAALGRPGP